MCFIHRFFIAVLVVHKVGTRGLLAPKLVTAPVTWLTFCLSLLPFASHFPETVTWGGRKFIFWRSGLEATVRESEKETR